MHREDEITRCPSAADRALALPEIRALVFERLGHGALAAAARVCRA